MFNEKIIEVIAGVLPYEETENKLLAKTIAKALWDSGLVSNSLEALEEQEPNIYKWTATENDGYTHSESGIANNMLEAFIKATEYSPSYHKYIKIEKMEKENYSDVHKELLDWYKEVK